MMRRKPLQMGVSVYPGLNEDADCDRIRQYLSVAYSFGFREIFTSVHLPEQKCFEQMKNLQWLSRIADSLGMQLTVDISGKELALALEIAGFIEALRERHYLRLDYGADERLVYDAAQKMGVRGFVLNASVLTAKEIEHWHSFLSNIKNVTIKACHNFYPRVETGLTKQFMLEKSALFTAFGIPVTCCIAARNFPRPPLFDGLPTVEEHRRWPPYKAALDLASQDCIDGILIGDPFASEAELRQVASVCFVRAYFFKNWFDGRRFRAGEADYNGYAASCPAGPGRVFHPVSKQPGNGKPRCGYFAG